MADISPGKAGASTRHSRWRVLVGGAAARPDQRHVLVALDQARIEPTGAGDLGSPSLPRKRQPLPLLHGPPSPTPHRTRRFITTNTRAEIRTVFGLARSRPAGNFTDTEHDIEREGLAREGASEAVVGAIGESADRLQP